MGGWSRDLGVVTAEDVPVAVRSAMARASGLLGPEQEALVTRIRTALLERKMVSSADLADYSAANAVTDPAHTPEELATIGPAIEAAKAAVTAMGGTAHVYLGGCHRVGLDDVLLSEGHSNDDSTQTSITVIVTVTTPATAK